VFFFKKTVLRQGKDGTVTLARTVHEKKLPFQKHTTQK